MCAKHLSGNEAFAVLLPDVLVVDDEVHGRNHSFCELVNALETDAAVYDCGNKQGFLLANIEMGMRDAKTKALVEQVFKIQ